jgi:hypothetical protein
VARRNLNSLRGYGKWNQGVVFMPPSFAGSFFHSALTHSLRCGLLVWRRLRRLGTKTLFFLSLYG